MEEAKVTPQPKFHLDEIVAMPAFTDSNGKFHPRIELLKVIDRLLREGSVRALQVEEA